VARIADRDAGALLELRDRLGGLIFDRARSVTGDQLVASLVTSGVLMRVWRCPADFTGDDLQMSLLSLAELRARQWLASTDNPAATRLAVLTEPRMVDDGWPRRDHHIETGPDSTGHNGVGLRLHGFGATDERGVSDA
jgi:hypothetical protein